MKCNVDEMQNMNKILNADKGKSLIKKIISFHLTIYQGNWNCRNSCGRYTDSYACFILEDYQQENVYRQKMLNYCWE